MRWTLLLLGGPLAAAGVALVVVLSGREASPAPFPPLDRSRHSVPLDRIVFDTFDGGFVRLSQASEQLAIGLRDRIPPVYEPRYGRPDELDWLDDGDLVLGYAAPGEAYAYPVKVLDRRELVNDVVDGVPILVSYCPLCGSGVVFRRRAAGRTLLFGNTSALYESDLVMIDRETGSYWYQVGGEAIAGPLTGERLEALPSTMATWREWRRLHPETRVLVGDGEDRFDESYALDAFSGYPERLDRGEFAFPVAAGRRDRRLPVSEPVLVVEAGGAAKGYPLRRLGNAVVNDAVGGEPVLVVARSSTRLATAFLRRVATGQLEFRRRPGGFLVDRETGTSWDAAGRAVTGPLAGQRLPALSVRRAFWFSIAVAMPGLELYLTDDPGVGAEGGD